MNNKKVKIDVKLLILMRRARISSLFTFEIANKKRSNLGKVFGFGLILSFKMVF
jgi:hypothetical protein